MDECVFTIDTARGRFAYACETAEERNSWLAQIRACIAAAADVSMAAAPLHPTHETTGAAAEAEAASTGSDGTDSSGDGIIGGDDATRDEDGRGGCVDERPTSEAMRQPPHKSHGVHPAQRDDGDTGLAFKLKETERQLAEANAACAAAKAEAEHLRAQQELLRTEIESLRAWASELEQAAIQEGGQRMLEALEHASAPAAAATSTPEAAEQAISLQTLGVTSAAVAAGQLAQLNPPPANAQAMQMMQMMQLMQKQQMMLMMQQEQRKREQQLQTEKRKARLDLERKKERLAKEQARLKEANVDLEYQHARLKILSEDEDISPPQWKAPTGWIDVPAKSLAVFELQLDDGEKSSYVNASLAESSKSEGSTVLRRRELRWDLGTFRIIYLATIGSAHHQRIAKYLICPSGHKEDLEVVRATVLQYVLAHHIAQRFEAALESKGKRVPVEYIRTDLLTLNDGQLVMLEACAGEDFRKGDGKFIKWNNNGEWVNDREEDRIEGGIDPVPQALSHFSFVDSKTALLLADVQGWRSESGRYILTDPALQSDRRVKPEGFIGGSDRGNKVRCAQQIPHNPHHPVSDRRLSLSGHARVLQAAQMQRVLQAARSRTQGIQRRFAGCSMP